MNTRHGISAALLVICLIAASSPAHARKVVPTGKLKTTGVTEGSSAILANAEETLYSDLIAVGERLEKTLDGKNNKADDVVKALVEARTRFFDSVSNAVVAQSAEGKRSTTAKAGVHELDHYQVTTMDYLQDLEVVVGGLARWKQWVEIMTAQNDGFSAELGTIVPDLVAEMKKNQEVIDKAWAAIHKARYQNDIAHLEAELMNAEISADNCGAVAINLKVRAGALTATASVGGPKTQLAANRLLLKAAEESKKLSAFKKPHLITALFTGWTKTMDKTMRQYEKSVTDLVRAAKPVMSEGIFSGFKSFSDFKYQGLRHGVRPALQDVRDAMRRLPN